MDYTPDEIAFQIIQRNAKELDVQSVAMLRDDISQAIQAERDRFDARISIMTPEPGDVIVLDYPELISAPLKDHVRSEFHAMFPQLRVIILDGGMTIDRIIRATEGKHGAD